MSRHHSQFIDLSLICDSELVPFSPSPSGEGRGEGLSVSIVIHYETLNSFSGAGASA